MNETTLYCIIYIITCLLSFGLGYLVCKCRGNRLASDPGICADISESLERGKERASDLADRLTDLIESSGDLEDLFWKYSREAEQNSDLEQDSDRQPISESDNQRNDDFLDIPH